MNSSPFVTMLPLHEISPSCLLQTFLPIHIHHAAAIVKKGRFSRRRFGFTLRLSAPEMSEMDLSLLAQIHPSTGLIGTKHDHLLPLVALTVLVGVRTGRWWDLTRKKLIESVSVPTVLEAIIIVASTMVETSARPTEAVIIVASILVGVSVREEIIASGAITTSTDGFQVG